MKMSPLSSTMTPRGEPSWAPMAEAFVSGRAAGPFAGDGGDDAGRGHLADSVISGIGDEQVAVAIESAGVGDA